MVDLSNPAFGTTSICLHCLVWEQINAFSPKDAAGQRIYSAAEIIAGLTEVLAEVIASKTRPERRELLNHMDREMRRYVAKKVASGSHPPTRSAPEVLQ